MFFRNFVPRLWFWPVRAKTQPRNKIPEKHFFLRGFHRTGCKLLIQYLLSGRQRFRQCLVENLIGGDCCCHCDGGKTKSTLSLLALGLGWSLTILEHSLNLCVKNNANMKGVWVFNTTQFKLEQRSSLACPCTMLLSKVRRNSVEYSNPYKKIKGQKYAQY